MRDILINFEDAEWVAPQYLRSEVERHLADVVLRSRKPEGTVRAVLEDVLAAIDIVPVGAYSSLMDRARDVARRAGAQGDEDYIAMALALEAPVWTLDKDFVRVPGVTILRTMDIERS